MNTLDNTSIRPARGRPLRRARVRSRGGAGWARQRGSALVEFPFAVLMLMLLLVIVADFGRLTPWAQQVAYSADAGAQFAYQVYNESDIIIKIEEDEGPQCNIDSSVCNDIRQQVMSAVATQKKSDEDKNGLGFGEGDIDIEAIWRCRWVEFNEGSKKIEVRYGNPLSKDEVENPDLDCTAKNCSDGKSCTEKKPVIFIEVTLTAEFDPFTPWIERIMPESLRTQTFEIRRQIFPSI